MDFCISVYKSKNLNYVLFIMFIKGLKDQICVV